MKKKFTFLMAALMLLTMFAIPMGMRGQTQSTYTKVTAAPSDWSGEYLLVYEDANNNTAYVWTGVEANYCYASVTLSSTITIPNGAVSLTIASMTDGYSIMVNGGTNNGKYIYGRSGYNEVDFGTTANANTITYESSSAKIVSNTSVMRFNSASNNMRFRYFKSSTYTSQQPVQLYKLDASSNPSISVSPNSKAVTCSAGSTVFTITSNIENPSYSLQFYEAANGDETAERPGWISTPQIVNNTLTLTYEANSGDERYAYFTVKSGTVESERVTLTQAAYSTHYNGNGTFTKVTSVDDLEDGGYYVLYGVNGNSNGAMNSYLSSGKMGRTPVTFKGQNIVNPVVSAVWKLESTVVDETTYWNLYNEDADNYCYISSNNASGFAMGDNPGNNYYSVSVSEGVWNFVGRYNNRQISIYLEDFRCYNSNINPLYLYKLGTPSEDPEITIADATKVIPADGETGSIAITLSNMTVSGANAFSIQYYDNENQAISAPLWMSSVSVVASGEDYVVSYDIARNDDADRTAYFKVQATYENQTVESNLVTFSQDLYVAPTTYVLANSIIPGKQYIFVSHNVSANNYYAMGGQNDNNRAAVGIGEFASIPNTVNITGNNVYEFLISNDVTNNEWFNIYDARNYGYLYAAGGNGNKPGNHLKVQNELTDNGRWTIEIENGEATITAQGDAARKIIQYNSSNTIFSCYGSGQQGIYLYAKADYTINISPYSDASVSDGWHLIASPLDGTTTVTNVTNMTSNNYDLYRFNLNEELEWENYKAHSSSDFTTLEVGRGYLYANSTNVTLGFNGTLNTTSTVTLAYDGWNLIGNSSSATRYVSGDYYIMNSTNSGITASTRTGGAVNAMEGIFVNGDEGGEITFSSTPPSGLRNNNVLVINLNRNDKVIDRAIARLNSDRKLSKLTLFDDDTKIYIPQNGADYAIAAMDDNTQAFSLNFHAKTTGKYTLSLGETSNLSYVHIFDRMTGEDVDMLLEDSYSFIGSPADSEERFIVRLNYNASPTDSETFAYQSGNGIIVNGEGELQIFDVTGRKVMTTTINGVQTVNGLNNGLYIFKLNEKTQKIVVR